MPRLLPFVALRFVVLTAVCLQACSDSAWSQELPPTALQNYVARPEPDFAWEKLRVVPTAAGSVTELTVTSQKWHDIVWKHAVEIFEPTELLYPKHAVLFVTGGSLPLKPVDAGTLALGTSLANTSGMRVVVVHQVPNQPLFDGRYEDDLITETWLKYLQDGDETWPLLFPMVKSAVKTMDAVQAFAAEAYDQPIDSFIITGASKRGWTSWLTPVADQRVIATAPMVIDTLNFRKQMQHQIDSWGAFSEQIKDYSSKGLIVQGEESDRERQLRLMMDPSTYLEQLQLPKLLVNGTNDPYWVVDAAGLYWSDLKGPRYALQIPNAGHGLDGGQEKAMRTIGAFARHVASGNPWPKLSWTFDRAADSHAVTITTDVTCFSATLWYADSTDLDFRDEDWQSKRLRELTPNVWTGAFESEQHTAIFAELMFETDGVLYSLCSLVDRR